MSDRPAIILPTDFPPAWAGGWGEDTHGAYAELVLGKVIIQLRWIPPGEFLMGSPEKEAGRWEDEGPQHSVTLSRGFWLASTPCTQGQWQAVMGTDPSHFKGDRRPVENVSWRDVVEFCRRLTTLTGEGGCLPENFAFRLPTEAEWEYACRAGTTSAFNDGSACTKPEGNDPALANLGWFDKNSGWETHPVGEKSPTTWGLHDLHGNVWEWCWDGKLNYTPEPQADPLGPLNASAERIVRGGSCGALARSCRSAYRITDGLGIRGKGLGFRLAAGQEPPGRGRAGAGGTRRPRSASRASRPVPKTEKTLS